MRAALLGLLGVGAVGAALVASSSKANAASVPPRRETKGKSGTVWFTRTEPVSGNATRTSVFGSRTGNDLVLMYDQTGSDKKTRKLVFAAPSTNAATAKADFIG